MAMFYMSYLLYYDFESILFLDDFKCEDDLTMATKVLKVLTKLENIWVAYISVCYIPPCQWNALIWSTDGVFEIFEI